jgi:hypothetical protein
MQIEASLAAAGRIRPGTLKPRRAGLLGWVMAWRAGSQIAFLARTADKNEA